MCVVQGKAPSPLGSDSHVLNAALAGLQIPHLNEEEFRFAHQSLAAISFKVFSEVFKLLWAISSIDHPLISMT